LARVAISEYKAKQLLSAEYQGLQLTDKNYKTQIADLNARQRFVVKVDQGEKKRFKRGLLKANLAKAGLAKPIARWIADGYSQFLVEPFVEHKPEDEAYLSLERVREGVKILYSTKGGVEIEDQAGSIQKTIFTGQSSQLQSINTRLGLPSGWLASLLNKLDELHISFVEINPLLVGGSQPQLLDCAALVDSAASFFVGGQWDESDITSDRAQTEEEKAVAELNRKSPASMTLKILNPNGSILMFLCGGGASIALADEAHQHGWGKEIINYGEYSGSPTTEETYLYTKQLLRVLLKAKARKKAFVFGGGVANFTDVKVTFKGVIEALAEVSSKLHRQKIKVFIRRGGPNEEEGLAEIKKFLKTNDLLGSVEGSDALVISPVRLAIKELG